ARHADADVILVGDIDRGGVFASLYGSVMLQTPEDRQRIKGIIINKFRGDLRLFEDGRRMIEELCQVPVLGVVPYLEDIGVEDEDSVVLDKKQRSAKDDKVNVAVVKLRHLSNFTDFNAIEQDHRLNVYYTTEKEQLLRADIIILPGCKATIDDLRHLKEEGVADTIREAHRQGKTIFGICGGYQMLGMSIDDPRQTEGDAIYIEGIGLLPMRTVMGEKKITCQTEFTFATNSNDMCKDGVKMRGYEIHQGISTPIDKSTYKPLTIKADGTPDGCIADSHCMGTYLHGCLDNAAMVDYLIGKKNTESFDFAEYKEQHYNRLADHIRKHVDMAKVYDILTRQ
ncbi:MAG: cobyric acid synthase, partial [Prevotellaceae bacterium]|nr:cobyric acid synthase [Prevotellaceae bacterium]